MTDTPVPIKRKAGRPKGTGGPRKSRPKTFKARLDEYIKTLPKIQPNDYSMLENLVTLEVRMEDTRKRMLKDPVTKKVPDALEVKKLSEAYTTYSKEFRQVQDNLGIGRSQRSDEMDMQGELDKFMEESRALVEDEGRRITCVHCNSDFEMGWVIFHFRDNTPWMFNFICPKCGKPNTMSGIREVPASIKLIESANGN